MSLQDSQPRRLVFMARGGASVERRFSFPEGQSGLVYWRSAAIDADTAPIREALLDLFSEHPLGEWLTENPSDAELREKLLRRVSWQLELEAADMLSLQIKDQLRPILQQKGWPVTLSNQAYKLLLEHSFEVASRPNATDRQLTKIDVQEILEEVAAGAFLADQFAQPIQDVASSQDILISDLETTQPGAQRLGTVESVLDDVRGQSLVWLHGAHGVGKSTLAKLLANRTGGRWTVIDLWPVRKDETSAIAAWRELIRTISGENLDGIIIDDFVGEAANVLTKRLVALVQTLAPLGIRVIVTSHQAPSPARLADAGSDANAIVQVPYFTQGDIAELVQRAPAPPSEMIQPWSAMLHITTHGGHPVLVVAKLASLRARNWPRTALVEDIGTPSEAVKLTREEARRDLLANLRELDDARSLEAGKLLRRAASVFDRLDEPLLLKLAQAPPALSNAGDTVAVLKGAWLEILPHQDLRVSPLIADISNDVMQEEKKGWQQLAAYHWLEKKTLDERTLPLCFWNALHGEFEQILLKICETMQTMDRDKFRAAAPILAPIALLSTETSLFPSNPAVALMLRSLQFDVADAVDEPKIAAKAAQQFLREFSNAGEIGTLVLSVAGVRMLMSATAPISPKLRLEIALQMRTAYTVAEKLSGGEIIDPKEYLPAQFSGEMDLADFLFTTVIQHICQSEDLLEVIQALDQLEPTLRDRFVAAIFAIYGGATVFINSGWSKDQLAGRDMRTALKVYEEIKELVTKWNSQDLISEICCALSVIIDEGLRDTKQSLDVIASAICDVGELPNLIRQKAKVLSHLDRHHEATELLVTVEDNFDFETSLDKGIVLREAGVTSAKAGRFRDAIRMLEKAYTAFLDADGCAPLAVGVLVEIALVQWRAGEKENAVLTAAKCLESLEQFESSHSRQAERSHQFARAIGGLMSSEVLGVNEDYEPPFSFGLASQLEDSSAELLNPSLTPLSNNWRILAFVEAAIGSELGIDARSMEKQNGSVLPHIEAGILANRCNSELKAFAFKEVLITGTKAIAVSRQLKGVRREDHASLRLDVEELSLSNPSILLEDPQTSEAVESLLLDVLAASLFMDPPEEQILNVLATEIDNLFGAQTKLEAIFKSASQLYAVGSGASFNVMVANGIGVAPMDVEESPQRRFYRDLFLVSHVARSLCRPALEVPVAKLVLAGWSRVINKQRFLLTDPAKHAGQIADALDKENPPSLRVAAEVLISAQSMVRHPFGQEWFDALEKVTLEPKRRHQI
ncbi:hypothetical protein K1718_00055 [Roseibium porphyridii]|uniref:AAA+ ATPase domain-containing protein n=1 Tax=Roseibium porphyridii TaxID=2866279 RepID=A0ABY8F7G2_9HYPH|nr:hypothetical protein [Roseibium sp. KMA01]WFE89790.1 hypothetical protein K1718_00055 [Roseibium sp. KMA01]